MSSPQPPNTFVWQDCLTPDIDQALDYISNIVSWNVKDQIWPNLGRYPIIQSHSGPIAGILEMPKFLQDSGFPPYWTGYVQTKLAPAEEAVPILGGQMFTMPTRSAMGTSFVFSDVGGAVLAAFELADSFSIPSSSRQHEFVWQRLYSANHEKSGAFYKELFGWQMSEKTQDGQILKSHSGGLVGDMGGKPSWIEVDTWVYFLGVNNIAQTVATIENYAGTIVEKTKIQNAPAVVSKDSQGGVIGFVEWNF